MPQNIRVLNLQIISREEFGLCFVWKTYSNLISEQVTRYYPVPVTTWPRYATAPDIWGFILQKFFTCSSRLEPYDGSVHIKMSVPHIFVLSQIAGLIKSCH